MGPLSELLGQIPRRERLLVRLLGNGGFAGAILRHLADACAHFLHRSRDGMRRHGEISGHRSHSGDVLGKMRAVGFHRNGSLLHLLGESFQAMR